MSEESKASVVAATCANFAIAGAKLLSAVVGGSAAMLADGIHSSVDGVNDLLLLFGLRLSRRPADKQHPFGHGKDLYFWALIVSCSIFVVGGVVSILEGVEHILNPQPVHHVLWAYGALAVGFVFDACSFAFGLKKFRRQHRNKSFRQAVEEVKDPSNLMVIFEDSVDVVGELIAAAGVWLNSRGWLLGDGVASVLIGLLVSSVAVYLIAQNRDLIVGEGVEDEIAEAIRSLAIGEGKFLSIRNAHSMYFGPDTVLVTMDAIFDPERKAGELIVVMDRIQSEIRRRYPVVKYIYIDPESSRKSESKRGDSAEAA